VGERFAGADGHIRFQQAIRELLGKRLVWTDYQASVKPGVDFYGAHATELGWRVISHIWPVLKQPQNTSYWVQQSGL
jgi:hypothetical protein